MISEQIRQKAREWHIHNDFEYWSDEEVAAFAESLLSGGAASMTTTKVVPMSCLDSSVLQTDRDGEYQVRTSRLTCNTAASGIRAGSDTGEESAYKIAGAAPPAAFPTTSAPPLTVCTKHGKAPCEICYPLAASGSGTPAETCEVCPEPKGCEEAGQCLRGNYGIEGTPAMQPQCQNLTSQGQIVGTPATPSTQHEREKAIVALQEDRERALITTVIARAVEREREECAKLACYLCRDERPITLDGQQWRHRLGNAGLTEPCYASAIRSRASQPAPHIHTASCYECGHDDCPCHGGYLHELPMCNSEPQGGKENKVDAENSENRQHGISATGASSPGASGLLASASSPAKLAAILIGKMEDLAHRESSIAACKAIQACCKIIEEELKR